MNLTISQQEQDLVLAALDSRLNVGLEVSKEWSEEGWATKADLG